MKRWLGVIWWLSATCLLVGFSGWYWLACFSPYFDDVSGQYGFWYAAPIFGLADMLVMLSLYQALLALSFGIQLIYPDPED